MTLTLHWPCASRHALIQLLLSSFKIHTPRNEDGTEDNHSSESLYLQRAQYVPQKSFLWRAIHDQVFEDQSGLYVTVLPEKKIHFKEFIHPRTRHRSWNESSDFPSSDCHTTKGGSCARTTCFNRLLTKFARSWRAERPTESSVSAEAFTSIG